MIAGEGSKRLRTETGGRLDPSPHGLGTGGTAGRLSGNKHEGRGKSEAIAKLNKLYEAKRHRGFRTSAVAPAHRGNSISLFT